MAHSEVRCHAFPLFLVKQKYTGPKIIEKWKRDHGSTALCLCVRTWEEWSRKARDVRSFFFFYIRWGSYNKRLWQKSPYLGTNTQRHREACACLRLARGILGSMTQRCIMTGSCWEAKGPVRPLRILLRVPSLRDSACPRCVLSDFSDSGVFSNSL